ncbi:hypothetical protein HGO21_12495 [Acinetobacter sp. CUI P1]|nr:hypothetical protein [Acinetobacter sp. CUI P1]
MSTIENEIITRRDENTGHVMADNVNMNTHIIISKAQKEAYQQLLEYEHRREMTRSKNWVACYHEPIKIVSHRLDINELGAILKLIGFMKFQKNGLLVIENKPINTADIANIIGKGVRQTKTILNRLYKENIIIKEGSNRKPTLTINKEYHTMGTVSKGMMFTKLYHQQTRKLADSMTTHEYGILYKILPFFHYDNYYLCANPDEQDENLVHFLNQAELADLIGEDIKTVRTYMQKLEKKGLVMSQRGHGVVNYIVHPDVMFRRESENKYTDVVRYQFDQLRKHHNQSAKITN